MRLRELLSGAADVTAGLIAAIAVGSFVIFMVVGSTTYREACVTSDNIVRYDDWSISPLAWFSPAKLGETETCESQTFVQYVVEQVPVVGESFEKSMGGPQNPEYYERN